MATETSASARVRTRGRLVVIEGPDCAGKTTVAKRLEAEHGFVYMKFPNRSTPTGRLIDQFLHRELSFSDDGVHNERAAQLLFAANNHESRARLLETLRAGRDVVLDRFVPSGVVYHSMAVGSDQRDFIEMVNRGMPRPDFVVVFELDADVAATRRADYGTERNDDVQVQRDVARGFRLYFPPSDDVAYVDANRGRDDVFADVVALVKPLDPPAELSWF